MTATAEPVEQDADPGMRAYVVRAETHNAHPLTLASARVRERKRPSPAPAGSIGTRVPWHSPARSEAGRKRPRPANPCGEGGARRPAGPRTSRRIGCHSVRTRGVPVRDLPLKKRPEPVFWTPAERAVNWPVPLVTLPSSRWLPAWPGCGGCAHESSRVRRCRHWARRPAGPRLPPRRQAPAEADPIPAVLPAGFSRTHVPKSPGRGRGPSSVGGSSARPEVHASSSARCASIWPSWRSRATRSWLRWTIARPPVSRASS